MEVKRNSNIELLRLALIVAVCIWHLFVKGYGVRSLGRQPYQHEDWLWLDLLVCAVCCPAVYCFMFISGYYGIKASMKKLLSFACIGFLSLLVGTLLGWYFFNEFNAGDFAHHVFTISSNQWWFFTDYVFVFLLAPLVNYGIKNLEKSQLVRILMLMTLLQISMFVGNNDMTSGSTFFGVFYMYVMGGVFSKYGVSFTDKQAISIYATCLSLLYASLMITQAWPLSRKFTQGLYGYNNPMIMLMAIMLFYMVLNRKPLYSKILNKLLSGILPIYLITEVLGKTFYKSMSDAVSNNVIIGMSVYLGIILILQVVGYVITAVSNKLSSCCLSLRAYARIRDKIYTASIAYFNRYGNKCSF